MLFPLNGLRLSHFHKNLLKIYTSLQDTNSLSTTSTSIQRIKVKKLLESDETVVGSTVKIQGWVRTVRDQKKFSFIEINDGSSLTGLQAVAEFEIPSYKTVESLTTGSSVEVIGKVVKSLGKGQLFEIKVEEVSLIGNCPADYPLQKKRHSTEFLRSIAHLRVRTNTISAVSRIRSSLAYATHKFFHDEGFVYLQSPLITTSDCEGAGEMFRVTTLPLDNLPLLPKDNQTKSADFSQDFFGKPAYLTVSGQLSGKLLSS
jgi:asparaginyl-tRNA synthetase